MSCRNDRGLIPASHRSRHEHSGNRLSVARAKQWRKKQSSPRGNSPQRAFFDDPDTLQDASATRFDRWLLLYLSEEDANELAKPGRTTRRPGNDCCDHKPRPIHRVLRNGFVLECSRQITRDAPNAMTFPPL